MTSVTMPMEAPVNASAKKEDNDDKQMKVQKENVNYISVLLAVMPCTSSFIWRVMGLAKSPFKVYTCFLALFACMHHLLTEGVETWEDIIGYSSCILEAYGLISVFRKIQNDRSVIGISGSSLIMFTISYFLRQIEAFIVSSQFKLSLHAIALEIFQFASIPLVVSLVWAVFKTYRDTYQESLDVLKAQYLLPLCGMLALILRPHFMQGQLYSYYWTFSFYVDVLALLPQVVMMARSPGKKVAVPIANFVAATTFSRCADLWFWYLRFDLGPQGYWGDFNYSGWIIVAFHVINLILVADFLYYYLRARCSAHLGEDKQAMVDEARGVFAI